MTQEAVALDTTQAEGFGLILLYRELGWVLTRVARDTKKPIDDGWQNAPAPDENTLRAWFERGSYNPGLRLGAVSGNLHDVDCDDERLVGFLQWHAPTWATSCPSWARGDRPHVLVKTDVAIPYLAFKLGGKTLLEVRGDRHQSLVPPAVHPSGERYRWLVGPRKTDAVPAAELRKWAEDSVLSFALSFGWHEGARHDLALAFAGWCVRRGVGAERAQGVIECVAVLCQDDDRDNRLDAVEDTYRRFEEGKDTTGLPTIRQLLPLESFELLRSVWTRSGSDDEERVGKYIARGGRTLFDGRDGETQLANFDARIVQQIRLDDGSGETSLSFDIRGIRVGGQPLPPARVAADEFASMGWVIPSFGAEAVISSGQGTKDRLRVAIQLLSGRPPTTTVYTHTGWTRIGDNHVFLHAGLGETGEVSLDGGLSRYRLPPEVVEPEQAVRASLGMLDVADRRISVPLWCAMFLAPLSSILQPDFTVWLWGPTGSMKSSLSAAALCHFGDFSRKTLPADWSSTANFLERQSFLAKDVPLVIDEFAPAGTRTEQQQLKAKADRLLRAQGNHSGRGRMRADTSIRNAYKPRGVLISTAEMEPPLSASAIARTLVLEVLQGSINATLLAELQKAAPLVAQAMAIYIRWMEKHYEELGNALPTMFRRARDSYQAEGHRRIPEMQANLEVAAAVALQSFKDEGILSDKEAHALAEAIKLDLRELGGRQAAEVARSDPAHDFMAFLREGLARKSIYLVGRDGRLPPGHEQLGWEAREFGDSDLRWLPPPNSQRLGWADEEWIFLLPREAYKEAVQFFAATDKVLVGTEKALLRALDEAGLIATEESKQGTRRTPRVLLEAQQQRVIKMRRAALEESTE